MFNNAYALDEVIDDKSMGDEYVSFTELDLRSDIFNRNYLKYIKCGYKESIDYNYLFSEALELIGKLYKDKDSTSKNSDIHYGISIISVSAKVTKTEIKSIRKSFKDGKSGFSYRLSINLDQIINVMISLLKDKCYEQLVKAYMEKGNTYLYRDVLIYKQFKALGIAKEQCNVHNFNNYIAKNIRKVYNNLQAFQQQYQK